MRQRFVIVSNTAHRGGRDVHLAPLGIVAVAQLSAHADMPTVAVRESHRPCYTDTDPSRFDGVALVGRCAMSVPASLRNPLPLVGRDRELRALRDHLAAALAGHGS